MNSTSLAIETHGLGKRFGERAALDRHRPRGAARLARSASSAPTAPARRRSIRLLLGLAEPTAGHDARCSATTCRGDRAAALARVGAIIEEPRFHRAPDRAREPARPRRGARPLRPRPRRRARSSASASARRADDKVEHLLARHAPAPRRRPLPALRPRAADPRRAGERARPGRHPRVPRPGPRRWSTRAAPCCSPRTCSTRSRRPATSRRSSTTARVVAQGTIAELVGRRPARDRHRRHSPVEAATLLAGVPGVTRAVRPRGRASA